MKYKLTKETKLVLGITLYRIRALKNLTNGVKRGELGGYIQSEKNLSQNGNSWVYENAQVYGNAIVYENAQVSGHTIVYGNASIYGNAQIYGNTWIYGNAQVYGNAHIYGFAWIYGDVHIDSVAAIIVLIIAMKCSVTVTKKLVFIGCKSIKSNKIKKITQKEAEKLGLSKEFYKPYKEMILAALKLIK